MRRISFLARYLWLRAMDVVCALRGYQLTDFPKGRFRRRYYGVQGVDFGPKSQGEPGRPTGG